MTGGFRLSTALGASALVMMGALVAPAASADAPTPRPGTSTSHSVGPSQFGLTISPVRLAISPGDINKTQEALAVNRGQAPVTVDVEKRNFTVDKAGALTYTDDAPYGASEWVSISPTHFVLQPGAQQVVTGQVAQPAGAESGDHQFALVFFVPPGGSPGNVKVKRGLAMPVFVTVPGALDDSVSLTGLSAPSFSRGDPVTITATMHNLGNVHRDFRAPSALSVTSAGRAAAFPDFTVPRESSRDISTTWDPPFMCICHPTVSFANSGQAVQTQTVRVIVFPWHLLAILVGAILLLLLIIRIGRRHYQANVRRAAAALAAPVSAGDA